MQMRKNANPDIIGLVLFRAIKTVLFTYPSHIFVKKSIFRTCPVNNIVGGRALVGNLLRI